MPLVNHVDDPLIVGVTQEEFNVLTEAYKTCGATLDDVGDDNWLVMADGWAIARVRVERRQ